MAKSSQLWARKKRQEPNDESFTLCFVPISHFNVLLQSVALSVTTGIFPGRRTIHRVIWWFDRYIGIEEGRDAKMFTLRLATLCCALSRFRSVIL